MHNTAEADGVGASSPAASASSGSRLRDVLHTFLPGAAQGVAGVALGHPVDTAKTRMQARGPHACRSVFRTMYGIARHERLRSLYRGVTPPLLMEGTKRSLQFALWDFVREGSDNSIAAAAAAAAPGAAAAPSEPTRWQRARRAVGNSAFLSGFLAGGAGTVIGCPMHVIKIQTQFQTADGTRNAWTCAVGIARRHGPLGFYRGLRYQILKDVCFGGTYLGLYAKIKEGLFGDAYRPHRGQQLGVVSDAAPGAAAGTDSLQARLHALSPSVRAFLAGATASTVTWLLLFPIDTFKTLIQSGRCNNLRDIAAHVGRPLALYRGLTASLVKAGPVAGAGMVAYEFTKSLLNDYNRTHPVVPPHSVAAAAEA